MASTKLLTRTVYKSLLRAAAKADASMPPRVLAAELARLGQRPLPDISCADMVRLGFKQGARAPAASPAASHMLNGALSLLSKLNTRMAALATGTPASRDTLKPSDVGFSVGQVFRHRVFGYRGVIVGWDASCRASDAWIRRTGAAMLPRGLVQPFYHVLVDVRDRPAAQVSYVAQDSVELLAGTAPLAEQLVVHPLLTRYFSTFRVSATGGGEFVPSSALMEEYPDDAASRSSVDGV